jgi:hypothetical protein
LRQQLVDSGSAAVSKPCSGSTVAVSRSFQTNNTPCAVMLKLSKLLCCACRIKERLQQKLVESGSAVVSKPMDWAALGVPEWLADRAERLGFLFPTGEQQQQQQQLQHYLQQGDLGFRVPML